jgi:hypothetical protein
MWKTRSEQDNAGNWGLKIAKWKLQNEDRSERDPHYPSPSPQFAIVILQFSIPNSPISNQLSAAAS